MHNVSSYIMHNIYIYISSYIMHSISSYIMHNISSTVSPNTYFADRNWQFSVVGRSTNTVVVNSPLPTDYDYERDALVYPLRIHVHNNTSDIITVIISIIMIIVIASAALGLSRIKNGARTRGRGLLVDLRKTGPAAVFVPPDNPLNETLFVTASTMTHTQKDRTVFPH